MRRRLPTWPRWATARRGTCRTSTARASTPGTSPCSWPPEPTTGSVPVVALLEGQRAAGRAVAVADVAEAPLDLGGGVRLPVRPGGGHLGAGQRLRDAVRGRGRVVGVDAPAALADPEAVEAAELVGGEPELRQEGPRDVAGVLARDV